MSLWHEMLRVQNDPGNPAGLIVTADELRIGRQPARYFDVAITIDGTVLEANGIDQGALVASTWYAVRVMSRTDLSASAGLLTVAGNAPLIPDNWAEHELVGYARYDGTKFLRFKNAWGANRFTWNEDVTAGDFVLFDGSVAAANTWQDVDASKVAPPGATAILVQARITSVAPVLMILRLKDKDLGNVGQSDTLAAEFARRLEAPVVVGLDAARTFQVAANSTARTVVLRALGFDLPR